MILYSAPLSLFARKVEIILAEKGVGHERVMVPFSQTRGYSPKHPAVLAANPKGQVPVLIDGDLTLYDSTIIAEYLDEKYPAPPLMPTEPAQRAKCRLLEMEADEVLLLPVRKLMHRSEPPGSGAEKRELQEVEAAKAEAAITSNFDLLAAKLGSRNFLCGDFSVADIATFMVVHYGLRLGGPSLAKHEVLSKWYARLAKRPSFKKVLLEIAAADNELSHPVTMR